MNKVKTHKHLSSFQIISVGFIIAIAVGTLLLMLPFSSVDSGSAPFLDSLFTATSATCVTGLIVHDTATYWTFFGQAVILLLIQIGGMGVVTVAIAITMLSGKKIGLFQRSVMQDSISAPKVGGIIKLTGFIIKATAIAELAGAVCMFPEFYKSFGIAKGIWYSIFHSVSAFCNAGFDLMGVKAQYSSLTSFLGSPLMNITVMALIIFGGLGFSTWNDIKVNKFRLSRYSLQSKVVLLVTLVLIVLPTIYFYFAEVSASAFADLSQKDKILSSLFLAVSPRTAGFNTVDLNALSDSGRAVTIFLMLIGGSPGSTAGGMKTTTVLVLLVSAVAVFRKNRNANCFKRSIPNDIVRNASAILILYLVLFFTGGIAISLIEGIPLSTCFFETASAVGTVGLTLGITPTLGIASRIILILLMYFGRVGGLTLIFATVSAKSGASKYPEEKITVG